MPDLRLEPLGPEHRDDLDALIRDPLVGRFTPIPDPAPADQADVMIATYQADDTREGFAAFDGTGAFVGVCMVIHLNLPAAECELGYMTAPAARGRGVAREMLRLVTEHALRDLGLQRLQLTISADNEASERVARANGFTCEGRLRNTYLKPGVRGDSTIWARLATDPVS